MEAAYGGNPADGGGTLGPDSEEDMIQEEYENEEQVATVTVVEDLDIDALIHPEPPSGRPNPGPSSDQNRARGPEHAHDSKCTTNNNTSGTPKKKAASAKKIKYETKSARLAEKKKQQARRFEKAARAGGKQSRPSKRRK